VYSLIDHLKSDIPAVSKYLLKSLKKYGTRDGTTGQIVFRLLTEMVIIFKKSMDQASNSFLSYIGGSSDLSFKLDALQFVKISLGKLSFDALKPHISKLTAYLIRMSSDSFYRVSIASLGAMEELIFAVSSNNKALDASSADNQKIVSVIFNYCKSAQCDHEVRLKALSVFGNVWPVIYPMIINNSAGISMQDVCQLLEERLKNETSRLIAIKCLVQLFKSPTVGPDMAVFVNAVLAELVLLLKKDDRVLRIETLELCDIICEK
jgi:hypothetical protein